jgi:hypothetical protein
MENVIWQLYQEIHVVIASNLYFSQRRKRLAGRITTILQRHLNYPSSVTVLDHPGKEIFMILDKNGD